MPAASPTRQPSHPLAWFDEPEGSALLQDEMGLLMPLLVRCTGSRICHVMPTERAARHAQPTLMTIESRLWCSDRGWHEGASEPTPAPSHGAHGADLLIAAHVIGSFDGGRERLAAIHRLVAVGGTAFFTEFYPLSLYRRRWRKSGLKALSLRKLCAMLREVGFEVSVTYALRPRSSLDSSGMLWRHNWRLPSWFPLRAYAIRARKVEPAMTLIGAPNAEPLGVPNA
jgi:hypothetical protein